MITVRAFSLTHIQAESMLPVSAHSTRGNKDCMARTALSGQGAIRLQSIPSHYFRCHRYRDLQWWFPFDGQGTPLLLSLTVPVNHLIILLSSAARG
jgi:hypothetical protein